MECWKIYAVLTDCYRPYTRKLKDWISFPKANGYESLHAVVMGPTGNWVEVQIRSQRMEEIAEKGFAAYWKYKTDDDKTESGFDEWLKKAQDLINNKAENAIEFVDNFKLDLFSDEIYVFTPQGKMITLPKGSTVLDFAYNIHSEIGDSASPPTSTASCRNSTANSPRATRWRSSPPSRSIPRRNGLSFWPPPRPSRDSRAASRNTAAASAMKANRSSRESCASSPLSLPKPTVTR